jgi:hypothetical protein
VCWHDYSMNGAAGVLTLDGDSGAGAEPSEVSALRMNLAETGPPSTADLIDNRKARES